MGALPEAGCGQKVVRWLFIVFNVVFTLIGLALVVVGSYGVARVKSENITDLLDLIPQDAQSEANADAVRTTLTGVAGTIITVGLVTMLISSCGWIGACKQNTCLLFTFSVCMIIIVLLELILGITVLVVVKKLKNDDGEEWRMTIINSGKKAYANSNSTHTENTATIWDGLQTGGKCCGLKGPNDWGTTEKDIPQTCYEDGKLYTEGCLEAYQSALFSVGKALGGVAVTFCLLEITGIVLSCYLAFSLRKGSQYEQH